jgi:predicted DsbA family dithiol-disulfide isomerase
MTIDIYSDIACPWCYIGERRFFRALEAFSASSEVEVAFRPFQLDPGLPVEPVPLRESLAEKFGPRLEATLRHTAATAAAEGLDLRFDDAQAVNTLDAHRLLRLALAEGGPEAQRAAAEGLFEAHFTNGASVADADTLAAIGAAAGLDPARVRLYLASREGRDEVLAEIEHAQRIGVRAVPTFVFHGRFAVQGAQPTSAFLRLLEELHHDAAGEPGGEADACVDGVCAA